MTDIADVPDILGLIWKPTTKPGVYYTSSTHEFRVAMSALGLPAGIVDNENIEDRSGGSFYSTNATTCRPAEINLDELNAWIAAAPAAIDQGETRNPQAAARLLRQSPCRRRSRDHSGGQAHAGNLGAFHACQGPAAATDR